MGKVPRESKPPQNTRGWFGCHPFIPQPRNETHTPCRWASKSKLHHITHHTPAHSGARPDGMLLEAGLDEGRSEPAISLLLLLRWSL